MKLPVFAMCGWQKHTLCRLAVNVMRSVSVFVQKWPKTALPGGRQGRRTNEAILVRPRKIKKKGERAIGRQNVIRGVLRAMPSEGLLPKL